MQCTRLCAYTHTFRMMFQRMLSLLLHVVDARLRVALSMYSHTHIALRTSCSSVPSSSRSCPVYAESEKGTYTPIATAARCVTLIHLLKPVVVDRSWQLRRNDPPPRCSLRCLHPFACMRVFVCVCMSIAGGGCAGRERTRILYCSEYWR